MNIITIFILNIFDFFTKKKILKKLNKIFLNKKIDIFFDVGAYHGNVTFELIKNFEISKIYAFEPNEESFAKLKKKVESKDSYKKNILIFNFGIGLKDEEKKLKHTLETSSSTLNEINLESKYFKKKRRLFNIFVDKSFFLEKTIRLINLEKFLLAERLKHINFLKIDTEGYEYQVLLSLGNKLEDVDVIHFEHHYDNMLIKNYKFNDIHNLLVKKKFKSVYKTKMFFRKSFEYIYVNKKFLNE